MTEGPWDDDRQPLNLAAADIVHALITGRCYAAALDETGQRCSVLAPITYCPDDRPHSSVLAWRFVSDLLPHAHIVAGIEVTVTIQGGSTTAVYATRHDPVPLGADVGTVTAGLHAYLALC